MKRFKIKIKNNKGIYEEWTGLMPVEYDINKCIEFMINNFNYKRMLYRDFGIFRANYSQTEDKILYKFKLIDEIIKRGKIANFRNN